MQQDEEPNGLSDDSQADLETAESDSVNHVIAVSQHSLVP